MKKTLSLFLVFLVFASCFALPAFSAELAGLTFSNADIYVLEKELAATGNYRPEDSIKRSEACVIFTRIAPEIERAK